ncbi:MAG: DUF2294 domain-containing protein [Solirubrobacteraceae bacterium]|jgi:uncharacterized protein YbcI
MPSTEEHHPEQQKLAVAISNAVVHVLREYTGRGPTQARTYIADDLVTCVMRDTLTKGERTLVEHGRHKQVLDTRKEFQDTMGDALTAAIEDLTRRKVIAYLSQNHIDPDLGIETFVLERVLTQPVAS